MSFKEVVERQRRFAIANPCQEAMQCADPKYHFTVYPAQHVACGVGLTVNIGQE
jgi:hypothetical protein